MLLAQLACCGTALSQTQDPWKSLRSEHPRLLALDSDVARIRPMALENVQVRKVLADLEHDAERLTGMPVLDYKAAAGLTAQSRRALDRISTLALLYRIDGHAAHLERALREMRAVAALRDWNPSHFADTAVLTQALSIGYDWLYAQLTDADRSLMRDAIAQKGLAAAIQAYSLQSAWVTAHDSVNIVCNAGMAIGALAVFEDETEKARFVLRAAVDSMQRGLAGYASDGAWVEGPGYWEDATQFTVRFLAAMDTALGTDFGVSNNAGFSRTGRFRLYFSSPAMRTFNYGDATDDLTEEPEMFWLARRYQQPALAWQQQKFLDRTAHPDPLNLIWYQREGKAPQVPQWPLDAVFNSVQDASFRSSWDDPNALFLVVKGGDNKGPHAHLDLGSFVLDAGGVRWALDLGRDDVNLPGYQGKQRWTYYRTRTEAHNTVTIDGENQDAKADAKMTRRELGPDLSWVQIDLSKAYPAKVKQMQRRIGMVGRQAVLIQDTVQADQPVDVLWGMVTDADVTVNGQTAELTKEGWTLTAEIRTPRHAVFDVAGTKAPAPQAPNTGTRKLVVRVGERVTDLDLSILLTPHKTGQPKPKITAKFPV